MSLTPAMIDALVAAGGTAEQLAAIMKADLAEREAALVNKRQKDAERQRRHRASRDVTVTECDIADSVTGPSLSPSPLPFPQTPKPTPRPHTHPDKTPARKGLPRPEDVSEQVWADFRQLRKSKRADLSQTALAAIRKEAARAGWPLEAALAECVTRGWQAFKADWVEGKARASPEFTSPC